MVNDRVPRHDSRVAPQPSLQPGSRDNPSTIEELLAAYELPRAPRTDRPWVICNIVATLDGHTAVFGHVGTLSTRADQALFHHLRGLCDAIMVGAGTVRAERYGPPRVTPELIAARRGRGQSSEPRLCIVSRSLQLDTAQDVLERTRTRPIMLTCDTAPPARVLDVAPHAELISAGSDSVDFPRALAALRRHGVRTVVCEGGPTVNAALLERGLVDELCITFAPFLGGDPLGLFDRGGAALQGVRIAHSFVIDNTVFVRALLDSF